MPLYLSSNLSDCISPLNNLLNAKSYHLAVIGNASDMYDDPFWVINDIKALKESGFEIQNFDLRKTEDVNQLLNETIYNGIFVAGGNSFYILELLKQTKIFEFIKNNIDNLLYIGSSAGSVICSKNIEIIKYLDRQQDQNEFNLQGLDLIDFQFLPHFGHDYFKLKYDKMFQDSVFYNSSNITLRDQDAIWVKNKSIEFVTSALN